MLFNSFEFAVFFPLVAAAYFLLPHRWRWLLLLLASYGFYMAWRVEYAVLLLVSTLVDFTAARGIAKARDPKGRRHWLWLSIAVNLGLLGTFKYFDFINGNLRALAAWGGMDWPVADLDMVLPMGISFYTFQTMSYTIDVYRGHMEPTRHLGRFALFVTFFPQLVAGPIERAPNLLPQFLKRIGLDPTLVTSGLKLMLWGFVKKVVVADRVSLVVDHIYAQPGEMDWTTLVLGGVLFGVQAYCDFSGYSDIAIGAARVLGIRLMRNFRTPYLSASIAEFWTRWHISLNAWFRDYVYIPLGGNRVTAGRWYFNLLVVFFISGLWHGAGWTYVLFGVLHGVYLVAAIHSRPFWVRFNAVSGLTHLPRFHHALRVAATFGLVTFSWFFFRAEDIGDTITIVERVSTFAHGPLDTASLFTAFKPGILAVTLVLGFGLLLFDHRIEELVHGTRPLSKAMDLLFHATLLVLLVLFGNYGEVAFMYFQF
ncbi:MAG: MBOAT family protein [Flavobacteriales bacterium]|nr:MBOAT family protein [Flavobacteriales bacterium]